MVPIEIAQVDESGRIIISPSVRKLIGLKPGEKFEVVISGNDMILRPIAKSQKTTKIDLEQAEDLFFKSGEVLFGDPD